MKKALLLLMSVILTLTLSFGVVSPALADDSEYGTEEYGIVGQSWYFVGVTPTQGFQNGDFEQGLKYWCTVPFGGGTLPTPAREVKIKEENGSKYMSFSKNAIANGLISPRFTFEQAKAGQQLVLIYDWRGVSDFKLYISQWFAKDNGKEINHDVEGGAERHLTMTGAMDIILKEATNDDEWNTTVTSPVMPIYEIPEGADPLYHFTVSVQKVDPEITSDVDNIRVGIFREAEMKIYDLDGTTVLYDIGAMQEEEEEEEEEEDTDSDTDADTDSDESDADTDTDTDADTDADEDSSDSSKIWIGIIIGIGAVLIVVAAVGVVFIILKKKKAKNAEVSANEE